MDDFRAVALASRGWASLVWHPVNGRLYNVAADGHADGPMCFGVPLVVLDMYEHSYYIDFQNRKSDYVDGFMAHLDWLEIDRRFGATLR
ncbi:MAG: Fe-Mn family superoxide dismutase [Chlamydiales bacterium]|jgi:Fe-Mn family superoxide dismutase